MWLSDPDYEGSYFNRAWLAFRGRELSQEIGGWISGIHPDDLHRLDGYAAALCSGQPFQLECRLRRHDGAWRWMLVSGAPRFAEDGELVGFIGSCVDDTKRHEAEIALAEREARLRSVTENFPGYIFRRVVHPDGRVEYPLFSGGGSRMGAGVRTAAESPEALSRMIHPEDLPAMAARYSEAAVTMSRFDCEGRLLLPDGSSR